MMEKFRALPNQSTLNFTAITSSFASFLKQVYLCDWWLFKFPADSKSSRIGVAGFISKESNDARVFRSAAISKRLDTVTLEAIDGIIIVVSGSINRSHTIQNGFQFEICNHFSFGFPYYWEEIAGQPCEQSTQRYALPRISFDELKLSSAKNSISFDDLPATFLRDFCVPVFYDSESCTITKDHPIDIPQTNGGVASKNREISSCQNKRAASEVATSKVRGSDGLCQKKKYKVKKKLDTQTCKEFDRSEGRITRSMTKSIKFQ